MPQINLNTTAFVTLADRLERLSRSAFPLAVRQTLNDAAFDVKNKTLPLSASRNFKSRNPNFFKTFSTVEKATGFSLKNMKAIVGMDDKGKGISAQTAVNNMVKQEEGGIISDGASYLADSRGGSNLKKVKRSGYYKNLKMLTGPSRLRNSKSQFIANAYASKKNKAKFSVKTAKGRFLIDVTSIKKDKNGKITIKSRALMKDRKSKPSVIKATHFMSEAANISSGKMLIFYALAAQKQFERALR